MAGRSSRLLVRYAPVRHPILRVTIAAVRGRLATIAPLFSISGVVGGLVRSRDGGDTIAPQVRCKGGLRDYCPSRSHRVGVGDKQGRTAVLVRY